MELRDGRARPVLPADRNVAVWHQALTAEIAVHLTPAHAFLLAAPVRGEAATTWFAEGNAMRRFDELDRDDRERLTNAVEAILSDIRRLAESGKAASVSAAWPALRNVPDLTHLFAVDGRPVLAGWGFSTPIGGLGPLAAFDDGVSWQAPPLRHWAVYGGTLAALAALGLFSGLLLMPLGGRFFASPAVCQAAPGQLALLSEQSREQARTDALKEQLAQLREGRGEQALQCPIPHAAAVPPATPPVPPAPPPRTDLPQDRWNQHDVSMLNGCWKRYTNMKLVVIRTKVVVGVKDWELCFDAGGHGTQTIVLDSGARCTDRLRAHFNDDGTLQFDELNRCRFDRRMDFEAVLLSKALCVRESDIEAICDMTDIEGPERNGVSSGRFRRADAPPP